MVKVNIPYYWYIICTNTAAILSDKEMGTILNQARKYSGCWKSIGLELGIDGAALDVIEKKYVNDHRRLIAMIELWHRRVDLKPSREAMETALSSNRVTLGGYLSTWGQGYN